jgi:uncharacterized protein YcbK (DUF882 family)
LTSKSLIVLLSGLLFTGVASADALPGHKQHLSSKKRGRRRRGKVAIFSGRLATAAELRDQPLNRPSGRLAIYAVNFHEGLEVNLYRADGSFDEDALDQLNHLFRCWRTGTEKSINPHLFEMLSRIYDHFGRRLDLISGFRNQVHVSSYHFQGSASDIRIPGIPTKELHAYVRTLDIGGMGIGLYPKSDFVHVDLRPEASYRWVDYSSSGTRKGRRWQRVPSKKR